MQQTNDKLLSMELEIKQSKTAHKKTIKEMLQKNDKLLSMQLEIKKTIKKTKTEHEKTIKEMQQINDKLLSKLKDREDTILKLKEQEDSLKKTEMNLQNDREVNKKTIMEPKQTNDQLESTPTKATHKKTIKELLQLSSRPLHDEYRSVTNNFSSNKKLHMKSTADTTRHVNSDSDTMPSISGKNLHNTPTLNRLAFISADKLAKKTK